MGQFLQSVSSMVLLLWRMCLWCEGGMYIQTCINKHGCIFLNMYHAKTENAEALYRFKI